MLNIMIVDDEDIVRKDIASMVDWNAYGYQVAAEARNGIEALNCFEQMHIDFVIMDIEMPVMDGLTAASKILEKYENVQIIFLTAYSNFEFARSSMRMGVNTYLLKHELDENLLLQELGRLREKIRGQAPESKGISEREGRYISDVEKVRSYLKLHCSEDISLEQLAKLIGVSEPYMSQWFKKQFGMSFKYYLRNLRMEKSSQLLLSGNVKIGDIALKAGYSSTEYFCMVFKQYYGSTPSEYRRRFSKYHEDEQ